MKAVVAAFNQEKALVGAFSMITNLQMELFEALVTCQIAAAHSGLISYLVIMVTAWPPPAYKLPLLISCSLQPPALDGYMRAIHLEHEI